ACAWWWARAGGLDVKDVRGLLHARCRSRLSLAAAGVTRRGMGLAARGGRVALRLLEEGQQEEAGCLV
ncbi:MAG TPA: hypothetical protein VIV12_07235, partial [Streptosporangiaceae bacterium]